jgi:hypothetical protein
MLQEWESLFDQDIRFAPNKLPTGISEDNISITTIKNGKVTFITDDFVPDGEFFIIKPDDLGFAWAKKMGWLMTGGKALHRWARKDKLEAIYHGYGNMFTRNRRTIARVSGFTTPSVG